MYDLSSNINLENTTTDFLTCKSGKNLTKLIQSNRGEFFCATDELLIPILFNKTVYNVGLLEHCTSITYLFEISRPALCTTSKTRQINVLQRERTDDVIIVVTLVGGSHTLDIERFRFWRRQFLVFLSTDLIYYL